MHGNSAAGFLDSFVQDEIKCRCLNEEDFGQPIDNEKNDVPLYDMYNRGLAACEQGMERTNLGLEGNPALQGQRPGMTGYIPSMEEALEQYPGASPKPKALMIALPSADNMEQEQLLSQKRRGLSR
jgi:hypothetical protein